MSRSFPQDPEIDGRPRGIAGRYELVRLIARGGMAVVYEAQHTELQRVVALKLLHPPDENQDSESFDERFRLEAQTLASLDHPNIVTLHDFGELEDGRCFLAMEYVDGHRLSDLMRDEPLAPDRAVTLLLQVCEALRYAHRRGVVHRDLKPSNLLVRTLDDGSEQVKVVDFGLVKLTNTEQELTRAGLVLGSPHCMAPEQIKGLDITPATDVYAVGVLLFRCLTGAYPFHGPHPAATMMQHLERPVPSLADKLPPGTTLPTGLEELIRRCLQKNPGARFEDMDTLAAALAATLGVTTDTMSTATLAVPRVAVPEDEDTQWHLVDEARPGARPRPALWVGALLLAVLLGSVGLGVGMALVRATQPVPPAIEPVAARPAQPVAVPPAAAPDAPPIEAEVEPAVEAPREPPAARTAPVTQPSPARAPRPAATGKPEPAAPKPVAATPPAPAPIATPAPTPAPKPEQPDGYKGLPEDW